MERLTQWEFIELFMRSDKETQEIIEKLLNMSEKESEQLHKLIESNPKEKVETIIKRFFETHTHKQ